MKAIVLMVIGLTMLTGCKDDYICELPKVDAYPSGKIVTVEYLGEQARVISSYEYFSGSKQFKCELENNPEYRVRFKDGAEITVKHGELVI